MKLGKSLRDMAAGYKDGYEQPGADYPKGRPESWYDIGWCLGRLFATGSGEPEYTGSKKSGTQMSKGWPEWLLTLRAVAEGLTDGWEQHDELTSGMLYPSRRLNEAYDHGVNVGQMFARQFKAQTGERGGT